MKNGTYIDLNRYRLLQPGTGNFDFDWKFTMGTVEWNQALVYPIKPTADEYIKVNRAMSKTVL